MITDISYINKVTARDWSDTILATGITQTPNYTGLACEDRFYYGYLGELQFRDVLATYGKEFEYTPRLDGVPDQTDFFVWHNGRRLRLNVKTASKAHYKYLMLPEVQFQKYHHDLYVGARLDGEVMHFEGWLTQTELSSYSPRLVQVWSRCVPFTELRRFVDLLNRIGTRREAKLCQG